jgi:predicted dehydrogenase
MHEINVAVVGCGQVANDHLKAWRRVHQVRVVAVSDLNRDLAKSTAEVWKIPNYYSSLSDLVGRHDVEVADICTPPHTHSALAVEAMKSGLNVLIEKPMTMTVKDAEEIVAAKETSKVKAGVIHNWLFDSPIIRAGSIVGKGLLGEVFDIEVEALNTKYDSMAANERHWCHRLPGGRFSEMLAHPIYLIRRFLGEVDVRTVQVAKIGSYPWMKYDELCAYFKVGERCGRAYASFNAPRDAIFINLYGTEAFLRIDLINMTMSLLPKRKTTRFSKGLDSLRQAAQLTTSTVKNAARIASGRWLSGHDLYVQLFVKSLVNGVEPPVTVEEGLATVRILEQMCEIIERA